MKEKEKKKVLCCVAASSGSSSTSFKFHQHQQDLKWTKQEDRKTMTGAALFYCITLEEVLTYKKADIN